MPTTTPRLGLTRPALDELPDGPFAFETVSDELDPIVAIDDQGIFADRPVSTPGTPGVRGRYYYVTGDPDASKNGILWRDYGTGWTGWAALGLPTIILGGDVDINGNVLTGTGFTVTRTATGFYRVNFSPALPTPPRAFATALDHLMPGISAFSTVDHAYFVFYDSGSGHVPTNTAFTFMAISQ